MEDELRDLKVNINEEHTFFLNQKVLCSFSGKLKKMVKKTQNRKTLKGLPEIKIMDFPGGPVGFEMLSRFCYNNGRIPITPSNISLLHCSAFLLDMTEEISANNLLTQTENFLNGVVFNWNWTDIITSLKNCEPFFHIADCSGLLRKLTSSLISKISENSNVFYTETTPLPSSPSSSSSADTSGFRNSSSAKTTPESIKHSFTKEWWFDSLTILPPTIIQKLLTTLGAHNRNLILTKFLLHYLKSAAQRAGNGGMGYKLEYGGLADTAVHGVVLMGRAGFSCRGLFWVLRVVSGFKVSRECRQKLERLIGLMIELATLDDLLVSGNKEGVYDVNLVVRLIRVFVDGFEECGGGGGGGVRLQRLKKVGRLVDKYLREISPDQSLKVEKFLMVAESLPDLARDCFDGVYRALDIYLQSHPALSSEECGRLCRCLNYERLTLEACRDLAKNPRISPEVSIQALISQQPKIPKTSFSDSLNSIKAPKQSVIRVRDVIETASESAEDKKELRLNLQKMQNRVMELENVCMEIKCQMSKVVKTRAIISSTSHYSSKGVTRLC